MITKWFRRIRNLFECNIFKTLAFNIRLLPLREALHLPILIFGKADVSLCKGKIEWIKGKRPAFGSWTFGRINQFHINQAPLLSVYAIENILRLGDRGEIGNGSSLLVLRKGILSIGSQVRISDNVKIKCYEEICIGDNTGISWESQIFDTNFHYMLSSTRSVKPINKAVRIGSHCWIGNRVTIMKGTLLPDGAIVASNSFVNKSFSDFFRPLVAGSPALLIRQGDLAIFDFAVQAKLNNFFQNTQQQEYVISDDEITQIMNI